MLCSPSLTLTLNRGTDILFKKLRHETGGLILKKNLCAMPPWVEISCKACLIFSNVFSGDLHIGTLVIGLYLVCLVTGAAVGEGSTI